MVYYGAVSKGCQRCRQRKIKCDQRKPECLRCEKAKARCPGFRNLADVIFRDESERIVRKARTLHGESKTQQPDSSILQASNPILSTYVFTSSIPRTFSQPISELGANFFFANYSCEGPPLSAGWDVWMTEMYYETSPSHALRAVIEAAGMAGISNVSYAPQLAIRSKEHYCRALVATNELLSDPVKSVLDVTLMTVILLGLFEFITFDNWERYRSWAAHIEGATTLLRLRGHEQFSYQRGGQLFVQVRSQILYACMQQEIHPPLALERISHKFETSAIGERRKQIRPAPMGTICFRLVNLRAAIKNGEITDLNAIRAAAAKINQDLKDWRAELQPTWSYATVDANDTSSGKCFEGKRHIYSSVWIAQAWNNWRTLRILVNQIILKIDISSGALNRSCEPAAVSLIRRLSTEVCTSIASFTGSRRTVSLIWPLSVLSQDHLNPPTMRYWAVEQLRRINSSMGFRQAGLFADNLSQGLNECQGSPQICPL